MDAETELKPCPNPWCKSDLPYVYAGLSGQFRVMCACGIEGPWASTEAEAIAAWNTRPTVEAQPQGETGEDDDDDDDEWVVAFTEVDEAPVRSQADIAALTAKDAEIAALRERVRELEAAARLWLAYDYIDAVSFGSVVPMRAYNEAITATRRALLEPEAGK